MTTVIEIVNFSNFLSKPVWKLAHNYEDPIFNYFADSSHVDLFDKSIKKY